MAADSGISDQVFRDADEALRHLAPTEGRPPVDSAVRRAVGDVVSGCREVQATLDSVAGALQVFTAPESGWGSYGLAGVPAAAAMKVVSSMASQYLEEHTEMGLASWIDFVTGCSEQIDAYVARLQSTMEPGEPLSEPGSGQDDEVLRSRADTLTGLRQETVAWKSVLTTIAALGSVVDAVKIAVASVPAVDGGTFGEAPSAEAEAIPSDSGASLTELPADQDERVEPAAATAVAGDLPEPKRRFGRSVERRSLVDRGRDAARQATQRSSKMGVRAMDSVSEATKRMRKPASGVLEWTARPLLDLKEQVGQLPSQLDRLSTDVALLEVLLDLHAASLLLHLGDLSDRDAALVNMRIASSVWLPELSEALREAQDEVSTHRLRIERLDAAHSAGLVGDRARSILVDEYSAGIAAAESRLARLTATADSWRDRGPTVLLACEQWVDAEIDLISARAIAEQGEQAAAAPKIRALDSERLSLLTREQERLSMAREALRSLR